MGKLIACVGDSSDHGGTIITSNQDGTLTVGAGGGGAGGGEGEGQYGTIIYGSPGEGGEGGGGEVVAVEGALHSCPIPTHGVTSITAVTTKTYHNGKLILSQYAIAGCGALIIPNPRNVYVE